jgi:LmbE family N-acetylglucosaminyl deacetylase
MDLITTHRPITAPDRCTVYRPAPSPRRWLGVWAHPDDESYLSAGAMDCIVRNGGHVTVVALSDGEAGFPADDPRPAAHRRRQRRAELRTAMAEIGVRDVRFLGLADGAVADALVDERADIVLAGLTEIIREVRPDIVATFGPDGVTGHPDHVACWQLATRAWSEAPQGELWYAAKTVSWLDTWRDLHDRFGMWMTEEPTGVDDGDVEAVLRLDGTDLDRKRRVLAGHHSQTTIVAEAIGEASYRRWIAEETFRRPLAVELQRAAAVRVPAGAGAS